MQPLADRIRPATLDEVVGQEHLVGERGIISRMLRAGRVTNMIFYGPPGVGKTTVANIIAKNSNMHLYRLNATSAGISDIKAIVSETSTLFASGGILLYLDEIQYFNKKQQQSLLEFVEDGRITLIASTTENPFFYVYPALLSRCTVMEFKPVSAEYISKRLKTALLSLNEANALAKTLSDDAALYISNASGGDVRRSICILEEAYYASEEHISLEAVDSILPKAMGVYDRDGDSHYDLLSAFQKSIRGSDPDASIFYLAKLLEAGELISVCRRLQVIASEDVGLAFSNAAMVCRSCVESARELGMPEASIPLSHATLALATAPKSNSAIEAYGAALEQIRAGKGNAVPAHLRDGHYEGATKLGRGQKYLYPHAYPNHYVKQQYLPNDLAGTKFYHGGDNKNETAAAEYWKKIKE